MAGDKDLGQPRVRKQMWRFALTARDAVRCSKACLLENGVEEDLEFSQVIRAWDKDQVVFIVRDGCPSSMREALHFLLGLCCVAPTALWFEDKEVKWKPNQTHTLISTLL